MERDGKNRPGAAYEDAPGRVKMLWLRRKFSRPLYYVVPGLLLGFLLLLEIYSRSAAWLFNKAMEKQELLNGTITVERIAASPFGHVLFENLEWKDPAGMRILFIPEGDFTVDIFDTVTQHFTSTTLEKLSLSHAALSIRLNDNMSVDFVRTPAPEERPKEKPKLKGRDEDKTEEQLLAEGEEKRRKERERLKQDWTNFNHENKRLDLDVFLDDCRVEVFYKQRHYLLEAVRLQASVDTKGRIKLKLATGPFGGDMIGSGIFLTGTIDCGKDEPTCDLSLVVDEVDPSSLGFGMDVHDPLSMAVRFEGNLVSPAGQGTLHFDRLRIPALDFSNVDGELQYEDAMFNFTDIHADVYGGKLAAEGWYNLDTRYYHIKGNGSRLQAKKALPKDGLRCLVELDITVDCKGNVNRTSYSGSFVSGSGRYRWMPFKSISGQFHDVGHDLDFYDVEIDFGGLKAATDALCISDGKLTLAPIRLTDKDGAPFMTYDPETKSLIDMRPEALGATGNRQ
ncbi:MAG: hypothetical protein J6Z82_06820 [Schwartzia sp.]|nr:hypothetical protein [Schwartzia sp. (in: firmicutes)]